MRIAGYASGDVVLGDFERGGAGGAPRLAWRGGTVAMGRDLLLNHAEAKMSITSVLIACSYLIACVSPFSDRYGDPLPPGALARLGTARLRAGTPIMSVAFSPHGRRLLTVGQDDGRIILWDVGTGKHIRQVAQLKRLEAWFAIFSPDGKTI